MGQGETIKTIAKIRIAIDRIAAHTESECLSKCVAYKGLEELERLATGEETVQDEQRSAKPVD